MRHRCPWRPIQLHHINYDPEETGLVYQSEHNIIKSMKRLEKCKNYSLTFKMEVSESLARISRNCNPKSEGEMQTELAENQRKRLERQKKRSQMKR